MKYEVLKQTTKLIDDFSKEFKSVDYVNKIKFGSVEIGVPPVIYNLRKGFTEEEFKEAVTSVILDYVAKHEFDNEAYAIKTLYSYFESVFKMLFDSLFKNYDLNNIDEHEWLPATIPVVNLNDIKILDPLSRKTYYDCIDDLISRVVPPSLGSNQFVNISSACYLYLRGTEFELRTTKNTEVLYFPESKKIKIMENVQMFSDDSDRFIPKEIGVLERDDILYLHPFFDSVVNSYTRIMNNITRKTTVENITDMFKKQCLDSISDGE